MGATLTAEHIEKIQKVINSPGKKEAVVKAENGKIVVLKVERTKV